MHRVIGIEVVRALVDIFTTSAHADKVIEKVLKSKKKWGSRDRKSFAESIYSIVRWWRYLWYLQGSSVSLTETGWKVFSSGDEQLLNEEHCEEILLIFLLWRQELLPEWSAIRIDEKGVRERIQRTPSRAVKESIPDWLDELGASELESHWEATIHALNDQAPVFLRTNTLRTSPQNLVQELKHEGVSAELVPEVFGCLKLVQRQNVFITQSFKKGLFEVQDAASQKVAGLLELSPGLRVVDACAGAGGKSLHIAALMKNKGKIIALDIHPHKLEELKKRAARGGVDIIETRGIDSNKVIKRLKQTADRLLLDVPCTGLGVLRRNPDTKWKLHFNGYKKILQLQREILENYSEIVKPGGLMVYATCSVLPSENEKQVDEFLKSHDKSWELDQTLHVNPAQGFDGFFAAQLRRRLR